MIYQRRIGRLDRPEIRLKSAVMATRIITFHLENILVYADDGVRIGWRFGVSLIPVIYIIEGIRRRRIVILTGMEKNSKAQKQGQQSRKMSCSFNHYTNASARN